MFGRGRIQSYAFGEDVVLLLVSSLVQALMTLPLCVLSLAAKNKLNIKTANRCHRDKSKRSGVQLHPPTAYMFWPITAQAAESLQGALLVTRSSFSPNKRKMFAFFLPLYYILFIK